MARTGITYLDVEKAALQLQGQARNPTVDNIRALLGTGSKTTIAEHLKAWKGKQDGQGKLPTALLAVVTGLWERLQAESEDKLSALEANTLAQQQEAQHQIAQMQQTVESLEKQLNQTGANLAAKTADYSAITQQLEQLQQAHTTALFRQENLAEQVAAQQVENGRLHKLAQQMQDNLMHYQESVEKVRVKQQLADEKQRAVLQQQLQQAQEQRATALNQVQKLMQQLVENETSLKIQQQDLDRALAEEQKTQTQYQQQTEQLIILKDRHEHTTQEQIQQKKQLAEKTAEISQLTQQLAVTDDRLKRLEKQLTQTEDKLASLQHDNQFLAQEKITLLGQIKQLTEASSNQVKSKK